ncbi:BglG family transcription antiterminator [Bacillus smithii]|uniref:BglG family transcription antiterminator n=1 Tax=Bacillus smithii TaxID=1479 RepID=UPI002E24C59B|nr:BglG family transcription antiterminator [Bacillus smithii]
MNDRQKDILRILLTEQQPHVLTKQLAERVNCSEKTVRNDLKVIDQYLKEHTNVRLIKKPNVGIFLEIDEEEKSMLFKQLLAAANPIDLNDEERLLEIAYRLLMETKHVTLKSFAEQYYIPKNVVKKDLRKIERWLKKYHLTFISKQKIGLIVKGTEQNKRLALANLHQLIQPQFFNRRFMKSQFPAHEVNIVEKELKQMENFYDFTFTDDSFESVLIHTLIAIKRMKLNQSVSAVANSSQVMKTKEYAWTKRFLKKLEPYFSIHFSDQEILYLTIHILGAKINDPTAAKLTLDTQTQPLVDSFVYEIIQRMSRLTNVDFHKDQELQRGLSVHLLTTFQRLAHDLPISNPMLDDIKKMYPYMFDSIITVIAELKEKIPYVIPEEETAYLTLHFQASYERLKKVSAEDQRVLIVCHMGIGMSQLIQTKLERYFRDLHIVGCVGKAKVEEYLANDSIDLVIATMPLSLKQVPSITVSPLLPESDIRKVEQMIQHRNGHPVAVEGKSELLKFIREETLFLNLKKEHPYEVIEELANALYRLGYVEKQYAHSAILREKMSATSIGSGIAIPHGDPDFIKDSAIAVATLKQPLEWGTDQVNLVFLMAVKEKNERMKQLFQELSFLSERPEIIQSLATETEPSKWIEILDFCLQKMLT